MAKAVLSRASVDYEEIDLDRDPDAPSIPSGPVTGPVSIHKAQTRSTATVLAAKVPAGR
jgi:hypothetical protein